MRTASHRWCSVGPLMFDANFHETFEFEWPNDEYRYRRLFLFTNGCSLPVANSYWFVVENSEEILSFARSVHGISFILIFHFRLLQRQIFWMRKQVPTRSLNARQSHLLADSHVQWSICISFGLFIFNACSTAGLIAEWRKPIVIDIYYEIFLPLFIWHLQSRYDWHSAWKSNRVNVSRYSKRRFHLFRDNFRVSIGRTHCTYRVYEIEHRPNCNCHRITTYYE